MMTNLKKRSFWVAIAAAGAVCGATGMAQAEQVSLTGANEVPAVQSAGAASGSVTVSADCAVTASIKATGFKPTMAHIHQGAAGANGPVIVPFTKQGDDTFVAPPGAKMDKEKCDAYKAGNTYVNVHSEANKGGEVRAQLKGK